MSDKEAAAYFRATHDHTCAFGYHHPEKGFIKGVNTACHMGFAIPIGCTAFYSSLRCHDKTLLHDAKTYWHYILSPYSPWRKGLKNVSIFPGFFKCDTDVPLFTTVNVCLAARTPLESPEKLRSWVKLQEMGFGRIEALYLSSLIDCNPDGIFRYANWRGHGYPFDPEKLSYQKLLSKAPSSGDELATSGSNRGIYSNHIWNSKARALDRQAPECLRVQPKYEGNFKAFQKPFENNMRVQIKQGIELKKALKEWKKEWGQR